MLFFFGFSPLPSVCGRLSLRTAIVPPNQIRFVAMEKFEFAGISTENADTAFENEFETIYDDCSSFHQSKEVFEHDADGDLRFKYRLCVNVVDLEEYDETAAGNALVELQLVPTFESLHETKRTSVLDCCGMEAGECGCYDVSQCGCEVTLASCECAMEEVPAKLEAIANTYRTVNSLRGFYLDKYVNRIGTTGWDLLRDFVNGVDFVQAAFSRYKTYGAA